MSLIEWNNLFLLGLKQFDEEHQNLARLLNKTYDSFVNNKPKSTLILVIDELIDYSINHFAGEENLMKEIGYPNLEMHTFQHIIFSNRVVKFHKDYQNGAEDLSLEILTFLKDWLSNHILSSDKEFGYFIASAREHEFISQAIVDRRLSGGRGIISAG